MIYHYIVTPQVLVVLRSRLVRGWVFSIASPILWSQLPFHIKQASTFGLFTFYFRTDLLSVFLYSMRVEVFIFCKIIMILFYFLSYFSCLLSVLHFVFGFFCFICRTLVITNCFLMFCIEKKIDLKECHIISIYFLSLRVWSIKFNSPFLQAPDKLYEALLKEPCIIWNWLSAENRFLLMYLRSFIISMTR